MAEQAAILLRLAQYCGATILFGSSLWMAIVLHPSETISKVAPSWPARLLLSAAAAVLVASLAGLGVQTIITDIPRELDDLHHARRVVHDAQTALAA